METLRRAFGRPPPQAAPPPTVDKGKAKEKQTDKLSLNTAAILARHENEQPLSSPRVEILGVASPRTAPHAGDTILRTSPSGTGAVALPPLHEAVIANNAREVHALLAAHNRADEPDAQGSTALHVAAALGNARLAEALLAAGASVRAKNHLGSMPLHLAGLNGHRKVSKLLLKAGAGIDDKDVSGNTPLLNAAMQGHVKLVAKLAQLGAQLLAANAEGNTGLHYASSVGDLDTLLLYLMTNKVAPDLQNNERATPLHYACGSNRDKCAEMLIEYGALPGAPDKSLATPLHYAAKNRALACVRLLVSYGVDVNVVDKDGQTALHQACLSGSLETVERLLRAHAPINVPDASGETPLHKASMTGFASIVSTLIDKDAVTDCTDKHHRTPLYVAARSGHTRCVELFLNLQSKRNVNVLGVTDTKGRTPLHAACTYGRWETTFLLLQMGASPNAQDANGLAALHEAAINGDEVSMSFLVSKRCNLLLTSNDGLTALHFAALNGQLRCVQLLIEQGVAVDITDGAGDTPLHYAVRRNHVHVAAFLLHSKANVNVANRQGITALHYAVRHGAIECVVRLVEAGADIRAADRDKVTPYLLAKKEGDPEMRLVFKFVKKNNHENGIGRHVFHDFRRLRAAPRPADALGSANAGTPLDASLPNSISQVGFDKISSSTTGAQTLTAKQRAAYAAITKAPPALLSPKRVLTDVNFNDLNEVVEVVQSEAAKQNARSAYAAVMRLLLLVPDDIAAGTKMLHVLEQAMVMVLLTDPRKAQRLETDQFLDALRKKPSVDDAQRAEALFMIERALPQLLEERRPAGMRTPRSSGKSPRGMHAISPRHSSAAVAGVAPAEGAAAKPPPPPPPPPPMLKRLALNKPAAAAAAGDKAVSIVVPDESKSGTSDVQAVGALEPLDVTAKPPAPAPPPMAKAGPPPPPMVKGAARGMALQQRVRMRKLNWEKVPIGLIPKTVWASAKASEFDSGKLQEEFQEKEAGGKSKGLPALTGPAQKRQIVELRRANQVGVLMAALKAPPVQIKEMIIKGEDAAITEDALRALVRLVPKDEEVEQLQPYKGQSADVLRTLGQAERLYLELMEVPRLKQRLEALLFRRTFPHDVKRLKERTQRAFNGINQLRTAPKLRQLLELILSIGNFLNEGTAVGAAQGFRLEALQKLDGTKSTVKRDYSLLNFIVAFTMDQRPVLTTFDEELTEVKFARLEEINDVIAEEAALRAQVDALSADLAQPKVSKKDALRKVLVSFEAQVREQSRELTERLNVMRVAYEELLEYYAAERGADIAAFVLEFIKLFKRVEIHVVRAREHAAAKARAKEEKEKRDAAGQRPSRKRLQLNNKPKPLHSAAPNLQVKLAMEGKPQTFANPLLDIDLDRVARRRSRTLSPEITALLTARGTHLAAQDELNAAPSKSPRSRGAGGRDAIPGGMSRSPSMQSTRDASGRSGDAITQPVPALDTGAAASGTAPPPRATARKRQTLGQRVMNPILSIFSIGPVSGGGGGKRNDSVAMQQQQQEQPSPRRLQRSTSAQPIGSADAITRSTSSTAVFDQQRAAAGGGGRRKRRGGPESPQGETVAEPAVSPSAIAPELRTSRNNLKAQAAADDINKGKERMDARGTNTTPERGMVDVQPAKQQFAKLRPVTEGPLAAGGGASAAAASQPQPAAAAAVAPPVSRSSGKNINASSNNNAPTRTASSERAKDPGGKPPVKAASAEGADRESKLSKRRSATFGIRLQPVSAEDRDRDRKAPLAPADIQRERHKLVLRVREREREAGKEQGAAGAPSPTRPETAIPTPSAAVFPPELMQEVKVEDLLREQFAGEKENALLLGELPLLTKKRQSVNVTELFGLHIQRSPSQDLSGAQKLSARGANVKITQRSLDEAGSAPLRDGGGAGGDKRHAKPVPAEPPADEPEAEEAEAPVDPEALRQLKALYPHLLDSVLESLLRSAEGDVQQAVLYLQKKGWVSQEPAPAPAPMAGDGKGTLPKKQSAFSTLRNFLGGKKNPFTLPEQQQQQQQQQHGANVGRVASSETAAAGKRKGVKF